MVTGIDIVRHQLAIAAGDRLNQVQEEIQGRGHAIECRIYAEDPEQGFYPSPGKIIYMKEPSGPGIRNDCGVDAGFQVPVEYDPILSKLIAHAESRDVAIQRMIQALQAFVIMGIRTGHSLFDHVLQSEAFVTGETFTDFLTSHFIDWKPKRTAADMACIAYIIDDLAGQKKQKFQVQARLRHCPPGTVWELAAIDKKSAG